MLFSINRLEKVSHIEKGGKAYLVAPVVAIRAGVLNNEFVPAEEIGHFVESWNGIIVPLGHPKLRGVPISANSPDIESVSPGRFWNASFDGETLRGEIWVDLEKANAIGGDALEAVNRLEKGEGIEVSTAYFRDLEETKGDLNGQKYFGIARNLRPDHLALLLHDIGACSWKDGCGVPRVNSLSTARKPSFDGTEKRPWRSVTKSFSVYRDGYYKFSGINRPDKVPVTIDEAPAEMKKWIASKSLLGDPSGKTWDDLLFFPVVNPGTNKLNAGALRSVLSGRGAQAEIPQEARESAQAMAKSLLEENFKGKTQQNSSDELRTGVMVALYPSEVDAAKLTLDSSKLPEGAESLSAADLHLTLVYLGDLSEMVLDQGDLLNRAMDFAKSTPIVRGFVSGIGRFNGPRDADMQPFYASYDCPYLPRMRSWLVDWLGGPSGGIEHGFTPHITLAYVPKEAPTPSFMPEYRELIFDRIGVAWGNQVTMFPLQGSPVEAAVNNKSGFNPISQVGAALRSLADAIGIKLNGRGETPNQSEEVSMDRKKLIEKLIANQRCPFDQADLEAMSDSALQKLDQGMAGNCNGKTDPSVNEAVTAELVVPEEIKTLSADVKALSSAIQALGGAEALKSALGAIQANAERDKQEIIVSLVGNEACAFGEEELKSMTLEVLQKLDASLRPASYAGRGGIRNHQKSVENQPPAPIAVLLAPKEEVK